MVPGFNQSMADGAQDLGLAMSLIWAGTADGDEIAAAFQPVACCQSLHPGGWQSGQGFEVEGCRGFGGH